MLSAVVDRYSTRPAAGQRRAIAVNLVMFIAFALAAVMMLTRTAVAANSINRDVASTIEPAVGGIDHHATRLPALDTTAKVTDRIAVATRPLSGRLNGVVIATNGINEELGSTLGSVGRIQASVDDIRVSTRAIRPAVVTLRRRVDSIHTHAGGIAADLSTVANASSSMVSGLSSSNASLAIILRAAAPLERQVRAIRTTVPSINAHARAIAASPILVSRASSLSALLGNLLAGG